MSFRPLILLTAPLLLGVALVPCQAQEKGAAPATTNVPSLPELPALPSMDRGGSGSKTLPEEDSAPPVTMPKPSPDGMSLPYYPPARKKVPTQEELEAIQKEQNWLTEALKAKEESEKENSKKNNPYRTEVERQLNIEKFGPDADPMAALNSKGTSKPNASRSPSLQTLAPSISQSATGATQNYSAIAGLALSPPPAGLSTPEKKNPLLSQPSGPVQPLLGPGKPEDPKGLPGLPGLAPAVKKQPMGDPLAPGGIRKLSSDPNFIPPSSPLPDNGLNLGKPGAGVPSNGLNVRVTPETLNLNATPADRPTPMDIHNAIPEPTTYNRFK